MVHHCHINLIYDRRFAFLHLIVVSVLRERNRWGDPGVDGRILGSIFRKWDLGVWTR
jgi:hypothetical protein